MGKRRAIFSAKKKPKNREKVLERETARKKRKERDKASFACCSMEGTYRKRERVSERAQSLEKMEL